MMAQMGNACPDFFFFFFFEPPGDDVGASEGRGVASGSEIAVRRARTKPFFVLFVLK
jgi:hypothetical protein